MRSPSIAKSFPRKSPRAIASEPLVELRREEVTAIPEDAIVIVATGPLTSDALAQEIARLTGRDRLFFYDSISPIVEADSVDMETAFWASRYGKSADGTADYLNCPLDREQYDSFVDELLKAQAVPAHIEEDRTPYFEACLPIEELARRGRDTLRFGPMKPVGLADPRTGKRPYAVVQLRQENLRVRSFNLVGFQNHLKFAEQARILRMIPGPRERRVPPLRPDPSQHLHRRARAARRPRSNCARAPRCCSPGRSRAWKGTWNPLPRG